jgi:hypothetical protein
VDLQGTGSGLAVANATSFQIICAGLDGNMGNNDNPTTPTETALSSPLPNPNPLKYFKVNAASAPTVYYHDNNEEDNMTNFFTGRLEDNKP